MPMLMLNAHDWTENFGINRAATESNTLKLDYVLLKMLLLMSFEFTIRIRASVISFFIFCEIIMIMERDSGT